MVEYWLAGRAGRVWLSLHARLRPALGELPGQCDLVARGEQLPAGQLWRAQDFAVRVWWRLGMSAIVLIFPLIGIAAAVHPGHAGTDAGAVLISFFTGLAAVAMAQMGLIRYHADRTRLYLRRANPAAASEPLPAGARGTPHWYDFWIMLTIALAAFGIIFSAVTR